jgi:hypothetical protein
MIENVKRRKKKKNLQETIVLMNQCWAMSIAEIEESNCLVKLVGVYRKLELMSSRRVSTTKNS